MRDIEQKISPLIASQFPSFYQDEGPNFIAFVKAYYEWLETNCQLVGLESTDGFNVGDTVTQGPTTGTIISTEGVGVNNILVSVDGVDTFRCFNVCADLTPMTSSSGGSSLVKKGGRTRRLGAIFFARKLPDIRDIDRTVDLFIVKFKEKFLKNIEFDSASNKKLLIKNSMDLYRSKGTERSIDLFFRLIYGVKSSVYYPGDDLFKLSEAEWYRPHYIEINSTSSDRAITLVGKQVTGVTSGATAFVEKYIKRRTGNGFVHIFYVSSVSGDFMVNELLRTDKIYSDSPRVLGSLSQASIDDGSEAFAVGDIVNLQSSTGSGGIGRVTGTEKGTGKVTFGLADSGWGYTTHIPGLIGEYSTNTFVSDRILLLANCTAKHYISGISVVQGGSGYANTDLVNISGGMLDARARPTTNTSGGIVSVRLMNQGSGFDPVDGVGYSISNTSGMSSIGTGGDFSVQYSLPTSYFNYLESLEQPEYSANAKIISVSDVAIMELGVPTGSFEIGDFVYQTGTDNEVSASGTITKTSQLTIAGGYITTGNTIGVFRPDEDIYVRGKPSYATFKNITLSVGVVSTSTADISDTNVPYLYSSLNGTTAYALGTTSGEGAEYGIQTLADTETLYINTDSLNNASFLQQRLNATAYGFPASPTANSSSVLYGALRFIPAEIGSIKTLPRLNPGSGYNKNPTTSVYQKYVVGHQAHDYIFDVKDVTGAFVTGEYVTHTVYDNRVAVTVANPNYFRIGERAFASNTTTLFVANGTVASIDYSSNTVFVYNVAGTFPTTNNYTMKSLVTLTANTKISNAVPFVYTYSAKGIVKSFSQDKLYVKRIQMNNSFEIGNTVIGSLSGSSANVVSIGPDPNSGIAGFNANVSARATTADGVISSVQIVDSGFGFSNDAKVTFTSDDSTRSGTLDNIRGGVGVGTGFYRSAKGLASDLSKIHDGDYYQEYSYDVISRIPLDRYGDMFKKVMHTAGTRFFGSVMIDSTANTVVGVAASSNNAASSVEIYDTSPYVIQDRKVNDVQDRSTIYIESREQ